MSGLLVTQQNIVEVARQCSGIVRASDADGTHGALFIQVDTERCGHDKCNRAYIGDMIVETISGFEILKSSDIADAA
jgi:hypothetical protein